MDCLLYSISVVTLFITVILSQMNTIFAQNPPRPVSRTIGNDRKLAVEEGSLAVLPCPVDRDENMFIEWSKDGSSLTVFDSRHRPTSSGSLRIKDTELTDSGMYKCKAINGFGTVEMTVQLIVFDKNGLPIPTTTIAPKSTTPSTTIAMLEIERIERMDEDSTSFSVDPMDSFDVISSLNPSHGPKISGSTKIDDIWSDKLTLPFVIASVGATFLVLIILLLLLSYVKLRSPINPKFNQVLDRSNGLFGGPNNLDHETRHYNMYPITGTDSNNHSTSHTNHSTPGHGSFTGLTTPSHHSHHPHQHQHHHSLHSTPPRQPSFPPPPPPTMPRPVNQMTPSHFTIVSHNHSNELRTVPSDKASSPVDSSVIYESPLEFDLKPNFAMKTPYGYLC